MNIAVLLNLVLSCVVYVAFLLYGMELAARVKFRIYKNDYIENAISAPDKSVLLATLCETTSGPTGTSVFYEIVYDPNSEMVEPDENRRDRCEYDSTKIEENFFYVVKTC